MGTRILIGIFVGFASLAASAQTPTQPTGSLQAGEAVTPAAPIAASQSISTEGLSATGTLNSTAPDSGPQQWKDVMGWISLQAGMSPDEVKALLGSDYRESSNPKGTLWTFQDQKALLFGSVSFKDGKLSDWSSPRF